MDIETIGEFMHILNGAAHDFHQYIVKKKKPLKLQQNVLAPMLSTVFVAKTAVKFHAIFCNIYFFPVYTHLYIKEFLVSIQN